MNSNNPSHSRSQEFQPSRQEVAYNRLRVVAAGNVNVQMGGVAAFADLWPRPETSAAGSADLSPAPVQADTIRTSTATGNMIVQAGQEQQAADARRQIEELDLS